MQLNLINTECCQNNNIKAEIGENIKICLYDVLELRIEIKINDPRVLSAT